MSLLKGAAEGSRQKAKSWVQVNQEHLSENRQKFKFPEGMGGENKKKDMMQLKQINVACVKEQTRTAI